MGSAAIDSAEAAREGGAPDPTAGADMTSRVEQFVFVVMTNRFDASVRFYRDGLGLELVEEWTEHGHGAVLSAGGHARVELIDADPSDGPTRMTFLGMQVGDIDGTHARLAAIGAELRSEPTAKPWGGRGFVAFDPNGVAVNLYTAYDAAATSDA